MGGVSLAGGLVGCSSSGEANNTTGQETDTPTYPNETYSNEPEADFVEFLNIEAAQRGNEVYAIGSVENLMGRPIGRLNVKVSFYDEIGDTVDAVRFPGFGILHGDTWIFEREWVGTLDEKRAVSSLDAEAEVSRYLNPLDKESEYCRDTDGWRCSESVNISTSSAQFVTVEEGGEKWTVYGELEKESHSNVDRGDMVAQYLEGDEITRQQYGSYNFPDGENTTDYRIEFSEERPSGELRIVLL